MVCFCASDNGEITELGQPPAVEWKIIAQEAKFKGMDSWIARWQLLEARA